MPISETVTISATGVSTISLSPELDCDLSWDDIRVALAVALTGSSQRAADALRTSKPTVVRRLATLESALGLRLFERHPTGMRPTPEGRQLLSHANGMRVVLAKALGRVGTVHEVSGSCRIALGDGIASFWLPRFLPRFHMDFPGINVQLYANCDVFHPGLADLYIQYFEPPNKDWHAIRLGTLHLIPFASRTYAATHRLPADAAELSKHRLLEQDHYLLDQGSLAALVQKLDGVSVKSYTNMSSCLVESVRAGVGIALLPTYLAALYDDFIGLDLGLSYPVAIWVNYPADAMVSKPVEHMLGFLRHSVFSRKTMPWFDDKLIMPEHHWRELGARAFGEIWCDEATEYSLGAEK